MPVKSRRPARVAALRALYQMGIARVRAEDAIKQIHEESEMDADLIAYAERLVRGIASESSAIRDVIEARLTGWDYDRLAAVDRTILRVGVFELLHAPEVPPVVAVNEAVELAKKYSTAESGKFVNGVLARVMADFPRPATQEIEEPAPDPDEQVTEELVEQGSGEWEALEASGAMKPLRKDAP